MNNQIAILILGHYRSGTSLVTRIVNLLGIPLGLQKHENEIHIKGITKVRTWEQPDIASVALYLHEKDRMFNGAYDKEHFKNSVYDCMRVKAKNILDAVFSDYPIYGLKHPAICLEYLFWDEMIKARKKNIICLRHPLATIKSYKKMSARTDDEQIAKQWATYIWSCFAYPDLSNSMVLFYDNLIDKPEEEVKRIADFLGLPVQPKVVRFIDDGLRHHSEPSTKGLDLSDSTVKKLEAIYSYLSNRSIDFSVLTNLTDKVKMVTL